MRAFEDLSRRAQVARLASTARQALRASPIEVRRLQLVSHGYNTIFRVDTVDGRKFALRLNVNSNRTPQQLRAEIAWLTALATDTDLSRTAGKRYRKSVEPSRPVSKSAATSP